jgi:hypothetical protein
MNSTYHLRALRYFKQEWKNHHRWTHEFLNRWVEEQKVPRLDTLVLIGPSGGYALPNEFLSLYAKIIAYEPDPLARFIFNWRVTESTRAKVTWVKTPYDFQSALPAGAILFCNLLGQVPIRDAATFRSRLMKVLNGRVWASFHDAMSGESVRFRVMNPEQPGEIETRSTRVVEVTEHLAPDLFKSEPRVKRLFWEWRITQKRSHLIEGVYSF